MYFSSGEDTSSMSKYHLVLESARFGDRNGFSSLWLPERHFAALGCIFPNPALLLAALARETTQIKLRAGSVVLPLHDPIQIAEEWAVVDNLSDGRVGIAFASGWHPNDFALKPDNYSRRYEALNSGIETVQKLWRREAISVVGGTGKLIDIKTYPTPIQKELPIWMTVGGNPQSFIRAGAMGANLLTHMFNYDLDGLAANIDAYRTAYRESGRADAGIVTVMLHTFLGEDLESAREQARGPYCRYLKANSHLFLHGLSHSRKSDVDISQLSDSDLDEFVNHICNQLFSSRALIGTVDSCSEIVRGLAGIGVDEIACFLDFGMDAETVLDGLPVLNRLRECSKDLTATHAAAAARQVQRYDHVEDRPPPQADRPVVSVAEPPLLATIRSRCDHSIAGDRIYREFTDYGINFRSLFQCITRLWYNDNEVLARLDIPNGLRSQLDAHIVHPVLWDNSFLAFGALVLQLFKSEFDRRVLPAHKGYKKVEVHRPAGAGLWTHCVLLPRGEHRNLFEANTTLYDDQGLVIATVTGLQYEFMSAEDPSGHSADGTGKTDDSHEGTSSSPTQSLPDENLSEFLENYLYNKIASHLGVSVDELNTKVSLVNIGFDSLMAIGLRNTMQSELGVSVSIANILESQTIAAMVSHVLGTLNLVADRTPERSDKVSEQQEAQPEADRVTGLAAEIKDLNRCHDRSTQLPALALMPEQRFAPFPLTDIQQAYWAGRRASFELGNIATHSYIEIDREDLDLDRFRSTWQRLIERHDMLRVIFLPDAQQRVLEHVPPYEIEVRDLRDATPDAANAQVMAIRERMSHQVFSLDEWPLFDVRITRLSDTVNRAHFSFDGLIFDAWSRLLLYWEWSELYENPEKTLPTLDITFRDYVVACNSLRDSELFRRSQKYWADRVADFPSPPVLPMATNPATIREPRFAHEIPELESDIWTALRNEATRNDLTPTALLVAAFTETLKIWSETSHFAINLTYFNRLPFHPQVNDIIGDFTSLNLLEVNNASQESFLSRARVLQEQLWKDLDHQYISGVEVMRDITRHTGRQPGAVMPVVFTSLLGMQARVTERPSMSWLGDTVYKSSQTSQVWLDLIVSESKGKLLCRWNVVEGLFPDGMITNMMGFFDRLLRRLAAAGTEWRQSAFDIVRPDHGQQDNSCVITPDADTESAPEHAEATAVAPAIPDDVLHALFSTQVGRHPDHPALIATDRPFTYRELHVLANKTGRCLQQRGAARNRLVAVVMEKGWEQIVASVGVLVSGAAYVPIDGQLPEARIHELLAHAEVELVLTQRQLKSRLSWPDGIIPICLDDPCIGEADSADVPTVQEQTDLAYVIYTSGSTGEPKGVMIDHCGAVNTIVDMNSRFGVGPDDRVLALSSLSFDLSVYDIFGTLAAGGAIVVPDADKRLDPEHWLDRLEQDRVTIWNSVPALMNVLIEYTRNVNKRLPATLRLVLLSGDWIPLTLPDEIKSMSDGISVISLGGATEGSIWSIMYPIDCVDPTWSSIPYGKPLLNQRFYVFKDGFVPCPVWVPGHLYIAGVGVARGYWRDAEKTEASFLEHPDTGERLYKTGDFGRLLPDGNIEFLGRDDLQVKIQGFRVELGEIEEALKQHPLVHTAVAGVIGDRLEEKKLVGYIVPKHDAAAPTADELRAFLTSRLAYYMVPGVYVMLSELPLSPNGKVNRKALPHPVQEQCGNRMAASNACESPIIRTVSELVRGILKLEKLEPNANVVNLGATSVDIIRIVNLFEREFGYRPNMMAFYRQPTVTGLISLYENGAPDRIADVSAGSWTRMDPDESDTFKATRPGLRKDADNRETAPLALAPDELKISEACCLLRRSHRQFTGQAVTLERLSRLLSVLRQITFDGKPKSLYASAGGLYPVQVYLYVKPNCVSQLRAGAYYFHPGDLRMVSLSGDDAVARDVYSVFFNAAIFDKAAFAVFLIAQLDAIAPVYGQRSVHYATIEAGLMSQLLELAAPGCHIGLCQIGDLKFSQVEKLFDLNKGHHLVHSFLGGSIDAANEERVPFQELFGANAACDIEREHGEIW